MSHGAAVGEIAGQAVLPRSLSPTSEGSESGPAENLPGLHPKAGMPEPAPAPAAVKEEPAETRAAEPAGAQAAAQDRKLSAYERLWLWGRRSCEPGLAAAAF